MPSSLMRWIGSFGSGAGAVVCCASSVTGEQMKITSSRRAAERRSFMMDLLEESRWSANTASSVARLQVRKEINSLGTYCRGGPPWPPGVELDLVNTPAAQNGIRRRAATEGRPY